MIRRLLVACACGLAVMAAPASAQQLSSPTGESSYYLLVHARTPDNIRVIETWTVKEQQRADNKRRRQLAESALATERFHRALKEAFERDNREMAAEAAEDEADVAEAATRMPVMERINGAFHAFDQPGVIVTAAKQ